MKIVFIGAGNLATQIALTLSEKSVEIIQVYSRTIDSASALAEQIRCPYTINIKEVDQKADIYIFSVKDSVINDLLKQMPANDGLWLHTAGSLPINIFEKTAVNFGVLYPFQTFSKSRRINFDNIPIFIEANNEENFHKIEKLSNIISNSVYPLSSEKRQFLHLTGVFACNFVNHLYNISEHILKERNIPFNIAIPLIEETANKIKDLSPSDAQTGPALRLDMNVIEKHLSLLENERWKDIYSIFSEDIYEMNKTDRE